MWVANGVGARKSVKQFIIIIITFNTRVRHNSGYDRIVITIIIYINFIIFASFTSTLRVWIIMWPVDQLNCIQTLIDSLRSHSFIYSLDVVWCFYSWVDACNRLKRFRVGSQPNSNLFSYLIPSWFSSRFRLSLQQRWVMIIYLWLFDGFCFARYPQIFFFLSTCRHCTVPRLSHHLLSVAVEIYSLIVESCI